MDAVTIQADVRLEYQRIAAVISWIKQNKTKQNRISLFPDVKNAIKCVWKSV